MSETSEIIYASKILSKMTPLSSAEVTISLIFKTQIKASCERAFSLDRHPGGKRAAESTALREIFLRDLLQEFC